MIYSFCLLFVLFVIYSFIGYMAEVLKVSYSFIGYMAEVLKVSYSKHRWVFSRGYLGGPYLPIFGMGSILVIYFLQSYQNDVVVLFIMSLTICCLLEYFTSLLLEKIYNLRWWDYSYKKYHINGRVCLENGILFGIAGVLLIRYFHPFLLSFLERFSPRTIIILGMVLFVIITVDFFISTFVVFQIKDELEDYTEKDSTEQVRTKMKEFFLYPFFYSRLFSAFPDILTNKKKNRSRD